MDGTPEAPTTHAEEQFSSDLGELIHIRNFLRGFCLVNFNPPPMESVDQLELAIDEAASNVMRHAYAGRLDGWIHLIAEAYEDRISVRLFHRGKPFDPEKVRPPSFDGTRDGGFGVYLIARSVDEVQYSIDEMGTNCITFVKKFTTSGE